MNKIIYFLVFLKLTQLLQRSTLMQEEYHFLFVNLRVKHCKDSPVLSKWTFHRQKQPSFLKKYLSSVSNFLFSKIKILIQIAMFTFVIQGVIALSFLKNTHNFVKNRRLISDYIYDIKRKEGKIDHKYTWFIWIRTSNQTIFSIIRISGHNTHRCKKKICKFISLAKMYKPLTL